MDIFETVAEPNRRTLLELLAEKDRPAGELVKLLPSLTQPAVSRHLRVLREARLVEVKPRAQQRVYALRPEGFAELDNWVSKYRRFWRDKLDALEVHLDSPSQKTDQRHKRSGTNG